MKDTIANEPVVTAFVVAAAALAAAFGWTPDADLTNKATDGIFAALALWNIFRARNKVTPV